MTLFLALQVYFILQYNKSTQANVFSTLIDGQRCRDSLLACHFLRTLIARLYIKVECYLKNKTNQIPLYHLFLSFKSKPNPFWAGAIRKTTPYRTEIAA